MLRLEAPIDTERLVLRPITTDDLDAVHAYQSRADVCRYLYEEPRTHDQSREWIDKTIQRTTISEEGDVLGLGVVVASTRELIGDVILCWVSSTHAQGEIGYVLHPEHAGRGYATEAAAALLRLGFDELGLHRISGRLDARNTASARVLEKLGMRREAHLVQNEYVKGEWCDEVIYAVLADERHVPSR